MYHRSTEPFHHSTGIIFNTRGFEDAVFACQYLRAFALLAPAPPNHSHHSTGIIFNTRGLVGAVLCITAPTSCSHRSAGIIFNTRGLVNAVLRVSI